MVPFFRLELVERKRWLTEEEFLDALTLAQTLPGAIAVNVALAAGKRIAGRAGALMACLGAVLPSFLCIIVVAAVILKYFEEPPVQAFLNASASATVGAIAYAVMWLGRRVLTGWAEAAICFCGIAASLVLHLPPLLIIALSACAGYLLYERRRLPDVDDRP